MASNGHTRTLEGPLTLDRSRSERFIKIAAVAAGAGIVLALLICWPFGGLRRFFLAYLVSYMFVLTIALGALFFVMLQHVTRAGWSVGVRRIPEAMAATMPVLAVLSLPILLTFLFPGESGSPRLYPWAAHQNGHYAAAEVAEGPADLTQPPVGATVEGAAPQPPALSERQEITEEAITVYQARHHLVIDHLTEGKSPWLNRPFFALRVVFYFAVWIGLASFYWRNSVLQDSTGDPELTTKMQKWAPAGLLLFAGTVTAASFDLVKSIDPHFFSTIFGAYIFAGCAVSFFATSILIYLGLRAAGLLGGAVAVEHFHDLGKFLFAFVFFWGYIAFSQFMLLWYAAIPETTYWLGIRGMTTVGANLYFGAWPDDPNAPIGVGWWATVALILLFGHLLIPFAGLLSRHVKRNMKLLAFWAVWLLVMHWIDLYWLIMPEMLVGGWMLLPVVELSVLVGMLGVAVLAFLKQVTGTNLVPVADPRLDESLAFHNI